MDEPNEVIEELDVMETVMEIDLDAETEEEPESADTASEVDTDEDPSESEEISEDDDTETQTPTLEPFSFSADGTAFDVPGAVEQELDDGEGGTVPWIAMPKSAWLESVQPHIADRSVWQRAESGLRKEIAALAPAKNPTVVEATALLEAWGEVQQLDPDALAAWVENGKENMTRLKLEAEVKALKAARETEVDVSQEVKQEEFDALVQADVASQVDDAAKRAGITLSARIKGEVTAHMRERVENKENIYFTDDTGLQVHTDRFDKAVELFAGTREAGAVEAEKVNAPKKKAPRQVAVTDSTVQASKEKKYGPGDGDKWREAMGLSN